MDIPRMKKERTGFTEETRTEQSTEPEGVAPDPLLSRLVLIDWTSLDVIENPEAVGAIKGLIQNCHAEVLRFILSLIKSRMYDDARLWAMSGDTTHLLQLGDQIYTRRRRR